MQWELNSNMGTVPYSSINHEYSYNFGLYINMTTLNWIQYFMNSKWSQVDQKSFLGGISQSTENYYSHSLKHYSV